MDHRLDGAGGQAQARGVRHRAAARVGRAGSTSPASVRCGARVSWCRVRAADRQRTTLLSQFGSTACKAQYRCDGVPRAVRLLQAALMSLEANSIRCRSRSVERETRDAVAITFAVPDALREQFRYAQGQHLTLRARHRRRGRAPLVLDLLRRAGRRAAHRGQEEPGRRVLDLGERGAARRATSIDVMPPLGHFNVPLDAAAARHYLGFAAGSGITPLLSIVKTTLATEPASRFTLVYGNRASGTVMFKEELAALKDTLPRPVQPRARAVARGAGHRAPARAHRPRQGRRAARALGARWTTSTPRSSAVPKA